MPTASPDASPVSTTMRLVPTPAWDPPYDDEPRPRPVGPAPAQPPLALTFLVGQGVGAVPAAPRLRLVPAADDDAHEGTATTTAMLPDARGWAGRLAIAAVEVLAGTRPVAQLRRWTSDDVYAQLRRQSHQRRVADPRGDAAADGLRAVPLTRVRALRVCEPYDGVAEASIVVDDGRRARALALRLEGVDGRWRCTELREL